MEEDGQGARETVVREAFAEFRHEDEGTDAEDDGAVRSTRTLRRFCREKTRVLRRVRRHVLDGTN